MSSADSVGETIHDESCETCDSSVDGRAFSDDSALPSTSAVAQHEVTTPSTLNYGLYSAPDFNIYRNGLCV